MLLFDLLSMFLPHRLSYMRWKIKHSGLTTLHKFFFSLNKFTFSHSLLVNYSWICLKENGTKSNIEERMPLYAFAFRNPESSMSIFHEETDVINTFFSHLPFFITLHFKTFWSVSGNFPMKLNFLSLVQ